MSQKKNYTETLQTMLQNEMRGYYKPEHEMPQVNIHSPKNLNQIVNLSNVLLHFNNESFERSSIFV